MRGLSTRTTLRPKGTLGHLMGWRGRICTCAWSGGNWIQNMRVLQSESVENGPHGYIALLSVWGCWALSRKGNKSQHVAFLAMPTNETRKGSTSLTPPLLIFTQKPQLSADPSFGVGGRVKKETGLTDMQLSRRIRCSE